MDTLISAHLVVFTLTPSGLKFSVDIYTGKELTVPRDKEGKIHG